MNRRRFLGVIAAAAASRALPKPEEPIGVRPLPAASIPAGPRRIVSISTPMRPLGVYLDIENADPVHLTEIDGTARLESTGASFKLWLIEGYAPYFDTAYPPPVTTPEIAAAQA